MTPRPSNEALNDAARNYIERDNMIADLVESQKTLRADLIYLVQKHGAVPPRARRTVRLETDQFQIDVSTSQTVDANHEGVLKLRQALRRAGCSRFFRKLFRSRTVFDVACNPAEVTAGKVELPPTAPRNLFALLAGAVQVEHKSPQLSVVERKGEKKGAAA